MEISFKDLKNIEITTYNSGFTVWVKEKVKIDKKYKTVKHWIVDGSCLMDDGEIRLGENGNWKINAEYNSESKSICITRKK
jgi:hypothetical protein